MRRENSLLRIQLDDLLLQRTLDEQRLVEAARADLSSEILQTLQGEFACSISSEVGKVHSYTNYN
jgi:hypothetical protein